MPLRVLDREGYGTSFHIAEAISFADSNGADVINLSLGMPDPTLLGCFHRSCSEKGRGGNRTWHGSRRRCRQLQQLRADLPLRGIPLTTTMVFLAVTSVNQKERKSDFANYGLWVDIAAPGENILSTYPVSGYAYWSGTLWRRPSSLARRRLSATSIAPLDAAGVEVQIRRSARSLVGKDIKYGAMMGAGHTDVGTSLATTCPAP